MHCIRLEKVCWNCYSRVMNDLQIIKTPPDDGVLIHSFARVEGGVSFDSRTVHYSSHQLK